MFKIPVCDPIVQTELLTARPQLATASLRRELLRYVLLLKQKYQFPTTIVLIIGQPTTERTNRREPETPKIQ